MHEASDDRISTILAAYARLTSPEQSRLLERLNVYMFASPAQRRRLRQLWGAEGHMKAADTCGSAASR